MSPVGNAAGHVAMRRQSDSPHRECGFIALPCLARAAPRCLGPTLINNS